METRHRVFLLGGVKQRWGSGWQCGRRHCVKRLGSPEEYIRGAIWRSRSIVFGQINGDLNAREVGGAARACLVQPCVVAGALPARAVQSRRGKEKGSS